MDKKIAGLLGAAAALATVSGANAATTPAMESGAATSYRDLLNPVPDALAVLKADDARLARQSAEGVKVAQVIIVGPHHHHHHHHHHHAYPIVRFGFGHHHHHHHHHHSHHHHHHHHHW